MQENAALLQLLGGGNWRPREKFRPGQGRPTARQRQFRQLRDHRRSRAVIREAVRLQGELLRLQPRHASQPGIVQLIIRITKGMVLAWSGGETGKVLRKLDCQVSILKNW